MFTYGNGIKIGGSVRQLSGTRWGARGWGRGRGILRGTGKPLLIQVPPSDAATHGARTKHASTATLSFLPSPRSPAHSDSLLLYREKEKKERGALNRPYEGNKHEEEKWQGETEHRGERNESSETVKPPGVQSQIQIGEKGLGKH